MKIEPPWVWFIVGLAVVQVVLISLLSERCRILAAPIPPSIPPSIPSPKPVVIPTPSPDKDEKRRLNLRDEEITRCRTMGATPTMGFGFAVVCIKPEAVQFEGQRYWE